MIYFVLWKGCLLNKGKRCNNKWLETEKMELQLEDMVAALKSSDETLEL